MSLFEKKNVFKFVNSMLLYRKWIKNSIEFDINEHQFKVQGLNKVLHIYLIDDKKDLKKKSFLNDAGDSSHHVILIIYDNIFNKSYNVELDNVEIWCMKSMQIDKSKHFLIDPHKILIFDDDESKTSFIKNELKSMPEQLPMININDFMVKYLNAQIGDIIEINTGYGKIPDRRIVIDDS